MLRTLAAPALGAVLNPIVERQIADAERRFRER